MLPQFDFGWAETHSEHRRIAPFGVARRSPPPAQVLENVTAFAHGGTNIPTLKEELKAMGYAVNVHSSSPSDFLVPQSRTRLWFIAICAKFVSPNEVTAIDDTVNNFKTDPLRAELLPLDAFLLPDDSPLVMKELERIRESKVDMLTAETSGRGRGRGTGRGRGKADDDVNKWVDRTIVTMLQTSVVDANLRSAQLHLV